MRIWNVIFLSGNTAVVFAKTRLEIWNRYHGIYQIDEVIIH